MALEVDAGITYSLRVGVNGGCAHITAQAHTHGSMCSPAWPKSLLRQIFHAACNLEPADPVWAPPLAIGWPAV